MNLRKNKIKMSLRAKRSNLRDCFVARLLAMTVARCLVFSGCGYTTKAVLPDNIRTIHVETFENDIDITKEVGAKDKYEVYSEE